MKQLHHGFLRNSIVKTNENVAVICKRFYALTLVKELWSSSPRLGKRWTYELCDGFQDEILLNKLQTTN